MRTKTHTPSVRLAGIASEELTQRQRKVLTLVVKGFDRNSIGRELAVHGRMVRYHLTALYRKAGVPSFQALQAKAGVLRILRLKDGRLTFGSARRKASAV
ncbi:MAG: hypothetical protein EXS51_01190 [Candidatus Taylorbacteria bacterium]|nr:hypothetical protein [Candidatus Taylorbacteria bacterium]